MCFAAVWGNGERKLTADAEGEAESHGHEGPVAEGEPLRAGVEGEVGAGTLGVVVRRGELRAGGVEAAAGHGAGGEAGVHRCLLFSVPIERASEELFVRRAMGVFRGWGNWFRAYLLLRWELGKRSGDRSWIVR